MLPSPPPFAAMPRLTAAPTLVAAGQTEIALRWPSWTEFVDDSLRLAYRLQYKLNDFHAPGNASWVDGPLVNDTDRAYEVAEVRSMAEIWE